jgi:hypothetical protein
MPACSSHQTGEGGESTAIKLYRAMDMTFWLSQAEATLARIEC